MRALSGTIRVAQRAIVGLGQDAAKALSTFEQSTLSLQAALASQITLSDNAVQNFQSMDRVAEALTLRLIEMDRQSVATFEDLFTGFNVFVAQGGLGFVRNLEEAVQATTLLVNASKIFSKQANDQLAIVTNIRAVLSGQSFQMSEVAQQVARSGALWKDQLGLIDKNNDLLDVLQGKLSGVDVAGQEFGKTAEGLVSSFETLRDVLLRGVFAETFELGKDAAFAFLEQIQRNQEHVDNLVRSLSALSVAVFEMGVSMVTFFQQTLGNDVFGFLQNRILDTIFWLKVFNKGAELGFLESFGGPFRAAVRKAFSDAAAETDALRISLAETAALISPPNFADILQRSLEGLLSVTQRENEELKKLSKGITVVTAPSLFVPDRLRRQGEGGIAPRFAGVQPAPEFAPLPESGFIGGLTPGAQAALGIGGIGTAVDGAIPKIGALQLSIVNMSASIGDFGDIAGGAFRGFGDALNFSIQSAILGQQSLGVALKKATAQAIASIAAQSIVKALFETASGFASLAVLDLRAAGLHFKSAAIFGAIGGAAAGAAKGISGGTGATAERGSALNPIVTQPAFGQNQQIIPLSTLPQSQGAADDSRLASTLDRMELTMSQTRETLDRLEGVPAGDVLTQGFEHGGGVISFMDTDDKRDITEFAHSVSEV